MKTKIYISGRISGLPEQEYRQNFRNAETYCSLPIIRSGRYPNIVNPCEIKPLFGIRKWFFFMCSDLYYLLGCSHVAFQKNWIDSTGARIEMIVALITNKKIIML